MDEAEILAEMDEGPEGVHPTTLEQPTPFILYQVFSMVMVTITKFGWVLVGLAVAVWAVWRKLGPRVQRWKDRREMDHESAAYHKDPDSFLGRERAIDAARRRMQEQYDAAARRDAEMRQQKEEEAKQNPQAEINRPPIKPSGKPKLRPEYNPMMSDTGSSSCGWRPGARRGGAGGG